MLLINKNTTQTIVLTLKEKSTLTNPVYLFKFTSDITRESVRFIATNISLYTDRYDEFTIVERSANLDTLNGIIELKPTGFWKYEVFEQTSATNLNEALSVGMVESGKLKVVGDETTFANYNNNPKKYVAYGKGA